MGNDPNIISIYKVNLGCGVIYKVFLTNSMELHFFAAFSPIVCNLVKDKKKKKSAIYVSK